MRFQSVLNRLPGSLQPGWKSGYHRVQTVELEGEVEAHLAVCNCQVPKPIAARRKYQQLLPWLAQLALFLFTVWSWFELFRRLKRTKIQTMSDESSWCK